MQMALDAASVIEVFHLRDHNKIREMSMRGEKLFPDGKVEACIAPTSKPASTSDSKGSVSVDGVLRLFKISDERRITSTLVSQQPHLGWNPPADKAAGAVWW